MYYYELFSHPDRFLYRAHILSGATCVVITCLTATLLTPFLLTYYTGDFWTKDSTYSEQPRLSKTIKYILITDNSDSTNYQFLLSSYSTLNRNFQDSLLSGYETESSFDVDGDGLVDQFRISFDLTFSSTTTIVRSINIWLIFQYELINKQHINMETMGLVNIVPPSTFTSASNKNLTVYGELIFEQRQTVQESGNNSIYNKPIIDLSSSTLSLDLQSVLNEYYARKYYTSFKPHYTWIVPRTTTTSTTTIANTITINVVVNIGRQAIRFSPGFWQEFKWGWIQYVCVLVPFMIVFNRLKLFVFSNDIVQTVSPLPNQRHKA